MEGSILEYVGADLIGVMSPVSICMLLVVLLVTALSSSSPSTVVTAANLIYAETPSDSPSQKLSGALLNAAVFVLLIAAVTFLLVLLYYFRFTSFLKHYMRLSSFFLLSSFGGSLSLSLLSRFSIPLDALTFSVFLLNFSVLGVVSVFGGPAVPIFLTQSYTVVLGIITAAWFTQLPEWTTWTLLVALALYDLAAVLAPGGPLKILVELSQSRDDDLPALVYEARPSVARSSNLGFLVGGVSDNGSVELQNVGSLNSAEEIVEEESSPLVENSGNAEEIVEEEEEGGVTRGIKLGLGDFVFYSVLVGRAALYDWMTVYACYLAIISGLGCTLILLSVCRRALPALPISIALGVVFYFLTRLLMEPFVVGVSTNLMMF